MAGEGDQRLDGIVVQFPGDAFAFALLGLGDTPGVKTHIFVQVGIFDGNACLAANGRQDGHVPLGKALGLVDLVRTHVFPDTKRASLCKYNTGENKEIEQKCCGGKVKMVPGFVCSKNGDASERVCRACQDFESKR